MAARKPQGSACTFGSRRGWAPRPGVIPESIRPGHPGRRHQVEGPLGLETVRTTPRVPAAQASQVWVRAVFLPVGELRVGWLLVWPFRCP
jgi:hypothetical protein